MPPTPNGEKRLAARIRAGPLAVAPCGPNLNQTPMHNGCILL
jgi:hypothetical protein